MKTYVHFNIPGSQASRYSYYLTNIDANFSILAISNLESKLTVELPKNKEKFEKVQYLVANIAEASHVDELTIETIG